MPDCRERPHRHILVAARSDCTNVPLAVAQEDEHEKHA
jgi:hypothetical protein